MSARRYTTIWCDWPGCGQWTDGGTSGDSASDIRRTFKATGWRRVHGFDGIRAGQDICWRHGLESAPVPPKRPRGVDLMADLEESLRPPSAPSGGEDNG